MINLLLADNQNLVREAVRALLETDLLLNVVGEAADGLEALRQTEVLRPDIVITEVCLPKLNGLEVVHQVGRRTPQTKVLILSAYQDDNYVLQALAEGAAGYVLKSACADELITAVREVAAGRRFLSPLLSERAIEVYFRGGHTARGDSYSLLSPRERQILNMIAQGFRNSQIAQQLSISPRTVEVHRANLMRKVGMHSQTELIQYAVRQSIL